MASKVHRVRFYNPKPIAVNSISFNESESWLAISREDASIEIWDMHFSPYLLKCIPGYEKGSIEALCWVDQRLISTGMGGALVEWDLEKLTSKWSALLTGHAAWCLDVDPAKSMVAVGTEQGYLNLFRVEPDQFVYEKLFDKQEGRIICCKFNKTGEILVTGSVATIRIWDVSSGLALHRLQASRRGKDNLVWSLAVLSDMTIVAGDSDGRLTFWDGNLAEQIESFVTHKADILCVVVSADESTLYCSGVDPTIVSFSQVQVQSRRERGTKTQWVKSVQRHVHEHDVRVLALNDNRLISLGADGYLAVSSHTSKWLMRVPPLPPIPRISTALVEGNTTNHRLLLLRYKDHIEVWKLGRYSTNAKGRPIYAGIDKHKLSRSSAGKHGELEEDSTMDKGVILTNCEKTSNTLQIEEKPVKLISIKAKGKRQIKCCTMSPNGQFVMYATDEVTRVFNIEVGDGSEEEVTLLKTPILAPYIASCSHATFTDDSLSLILHADTHTLTVLNVDASTGLTLAQKIDFSMYVKGSLLHLLTATSESSDTTHLIVAGTGGGAVAWRRTAEAQFKHHVTLPTYSCVATAMALDRKHDSLLMVHSDKCILEYDLGACRFNSWPRRVSSNWARGLPALTGASYHPCHPHHILLTDNTSVWILDKTNAQTELEHPDISDEPVVKKKAGTRKRELKPKAIPCKYLAGLSWVGDEAVLVEVLPENIIAQLPAVLATKRFQEA